MPGRRSVSWEECLSSLGHRISVGLKSWKIGMTMVGAFTHWFWSRLKSIELVMKK